MKRKKFLIILFSLGIFILFLSSCENHFISAALGKKTIKFETNGGNPVASQVILHGERIAKPADPEKQGSVFLGWYEDNMIFSMEWDFDKAPGEDMILFAKWDNFGFGGGDPVYAPIVVDFTIDDLAGNIITETVISRSGAGGLPTSVTFNLPAGNYTDISWTLNNAAVGTGTSLTLNASDYSPGTRFLSLSVTIGGALYGKTIELTVVN